MRRKFSFAVGEYYHIYNRGVDKREIFSDRRDYERFVKLLYLCNSSISVDFDNINNGKEFEIIRGDQIVAIGVWCLMPNHFHLLFRVLDLDTDSDNREAKPPGYNGISAFMHKVQTAYSMYFNRKYERTGCLFQGPFKAQHVDNDRYLKYLFAYIHLNPISLVEKNWKENGLSDPAKAKSFLRCQEFSSYSDYMGDLRNEGKILSMNNFPKYFEYANSFEKYLDLWTNYREAKPPGSYPQVFASN